MKSKYFLLLSILFCTEKKSFCQDMRFIQINAIDTIELKPVQFIYQISLQNSSMYLSDVMTTINQKTNSDKEGFVQSKRKPDNNASYKQIINILDSAKFAYTISEGSNYAINMNRSNDSAILVRLNSEADLKKIYHLFNSFDNITSHISHIEYESASSFKNEMYSKLYIKAKADATLIAGVSGNSIGQLISVDEEKNLVADILDEIKDAEMSVSSIFPFQKKNNYNKQIYRKLLFKFQLK